jgi:hypothetical protein
MGLRDSQPLPVPSGATNDGPGPTIAGSFVVTAARCNEVA